MQVRRRTVLAIGGAAAIGAVGGAIGIHGLQTSREAPPLTPTERITYDGWRQSRKPPYFIGHRGAGDVVPEHTLPSYLTALGWGCKAIEVSVVRSADDEVFCLHDLTLDRTTTGSGPARNHSADFLRGVHVDIPRLGPRWSGADRPALPRLTDVLRAINGQAVLCLEAKDDGAFPLMTDIVEKSGVKDTVMIKLPGTATARLAMAKEAGYPIYAYLGNPEVATATAIDRLGKSLDPERDALVLPAGGVAGLFPSDLIVRAVKTGVPVWVVPVHRRYEVEHFVRLGVHGMVSPDVGYVAGLQPPITADVWADGGISAGELTLDPYNDRYGLQWDEKGVIGIDAPNQAAFVSLGQFCPIPATSYRLTFDASFDPMPTDPWFHLSVAFGHADDRYYEHRAANANGYHAQLRADGRMALYAHVEGNPNGQPLTPTRQGKRFKRGGWSRIMLDVTPSTIRVARDDGTFVEASDERFRGGYLHIGRSGPDGTLKIRNLTVT